MPYKGQEEMRKMAGIGDQIKSANDSVSQWAKKTTSAVSEWWEEVNAITDRRNKIREMAREREDVLVEMGAKVYTLHRRGKVQNRDLLKDCERIEVIAADIDRMELEITEIKRRKAEVRPHEVAVTDDTPVVADEDIDVSAAGDLDIEPEVPKEETFPCAHARSAVEGPAEGDQAEASGECVVEPGSERTMEPAEMPLDTPLVDKELAVPCAHDQAAVEGPAEGDEADIPVDCPVDEAPPRDQ